MTLLTLAIGASACGGADPDAGGEDRPEPVSQVPEVALRERITRFTDGITREGNYREPTAAERRKVAAGVGHVLDGDLTQAEQALSAVGYTVRTLRDGESELTFAEVAAAEPDGGTDDDPDDRGWGRLYVRLDAEPPGWSVQVPHPTSDLNTAGIGISLLLGEAPGGVLVVAGAHRDAGEGGSADVAHREDTVFHKVCDELTERGLPALQVHGFADSSLPGEDVIVSTGAGHEARREARRLADALQERRLRVCRAWERDCGDLEGRTNEQGELADALDVPFLHLELSRTVRDSELRTRSAVNAMSEVTASWAASPPSASPAESS